MLVKWGSIIVKGSGKLGGHVFSSGASGASVHTLARARNPQSRNQMAVRSRFTELTQSWRDLTENERESWYDAESSFSRVNRFGDVVTLSGKNLYESLNTNRQILGLSVINMAPLPAEIPKNRVTEVEISVSTIQIEIFGDFEPSTTYVVVATPGLSNGVRFFNNSIRNIGIGPTDAAGARIPGVQTQYGNYKKQFGTPIPGTKTFVGTYSVSTSGQRSPISVVQAVFI